MTISKIVPMTWLETKAWQDSKNFTEENVREAFDTGAWWEHFDVIAIAEEDIEALVTAAIVEQIKLGSGLDRTWFTQPDNIQCLIPGPTSKIEDRARQAVTRIIESMREHIQKANDELEASSD